MASCSFI